MKNKIVYIFNNYDLFAELMFKKQKEIHLINYGKFLLRLFQYVRKPFSDRKMPIPKLMIFKDCCKIQSMPKKSKLNTIKAKMHRMEIEYNRKAIFKAYFLRLFKIANLF